MVLGFLRRRRGRGGSPAAQGSQLGPRGQMTPEGYIPTPEELQHHPEQVALPLRKAEDGDPGPSPLDRLQGRGPGHDRAPL